MKAKNVLSAVVWLAALSWVYQWSCNDKASRNPDLIKQQIDTLCTPQQDTIVNNAQKDIFVCLETDDETSFTHTKVLESIEDPDNTILEFPVDQLFKKYWKNQTQPHPLAVSWVARRIRSLLWNGWIESTDVQQSLNPRIEDITSETKYEIWDTIRFRLIETSIKEFFPQNLYLIFSEAWFETFFDKDSLIIKKRNLEWEYGEDLVSKQDSIALDTLKIDSLAINPSELDSLKQDSQVVDSLKTESSTLDSLNTVEKTHDYIYDVVVKSIPGWESALWLYRDGKLFMAWKVSVWLPGHNTRTWQFEIQRANAYVRSSKYWNSPMPYALQYSWPYYFHQWVVDWRPKSHWCIREKWLRAWVSYSLLKDKSNVDVYIDKNLYKQKTHKTYSRQKK